MTMEMHQIRYFLALARTLNFTRAAAECNVTQPALTRAVQALEGELGGELVRRERQLTHLTELGKQMLPLIQRCYDSASAARDLARSMTTREAAPLAVAVSHSVNLALFMPAVAEVFRAHAGVQLKLMRGGGAEVLKLLKEGDIDLAIAGPLDEPWERLDSWPLFSERFELTVHADHPLAGANTVGAERLADQKIFFQAGCESRTEVMRRLGVHAFAEPAGHQVVTQHDVIALLEANLGVALVPASAAQGASLRRVRLDDAGLQRTVSIYGVAGRQRSAPCTTFLNLLRSAEWNAAA